jgi:dihydroorotase
MDLHGRFSRYTSTRYLITAAAAAVVPATDSGVTDISRCLPALKAMADLGVLLLVHGEVTDSEVDMFDREAVFIDTKLVGCASGFWCLRCCG